MKKKQLNQYTSDQQPDDEMPENVTGKTEPWYPVRESGDVSCPYCSSTGIRKGTGYNYCRDFKKIWQISVNNTKCERMTTTHARLCLTCDINFLPSPAIRKSSSPGISESDEPSYQRIKTSPACRKTHDTTAPDVI